MALEIKIGADVSQGISGVNSVSEALVQLEKRGLLSLDSVTGAMKNLQTIIKSTADKGDLAKLNKAYEELAHKAKELKSAGLESSMTGLTVGTQRASSSLLNLSRTFDVLPPEVAHVAHSFDQLFNVYERIRETQSSTGAALKEFGGLLTGPVGIGLGISVVTSLLVGFVAELFNTKDAAEASATAMKGFDDILGSIKTTAGDLKSNLDFANQIGAINNQINFFGNGIGGSLEDLRQQSVGQRQFTQDILDQQVRVRKGMDDARNNEDLSAKDRIQVIDSFNKELLDLQKQENDSRNRQSIIYRQIALQKLKDAKEASDLEIENEKKRLEELQKRLELERHIRLAHLSKLKDIADAQAAATGEDIRRPGLSPKKDLSLDPRSLTSGVNAALQVDVAANKIRNALIAMKKELISVRSIAEGVSNAVGSIFDAFAKGENVFKAIGDAIKQVIVDLIKAAIQAFVFNTIINAFTGGVGGKLTTIGGIIGAGLQGHASGGNVKAGVPIIVGEVGREVFVPDVPGHVVPNNQLGSIGGGLAVAVAISGRFRGRDFLLGNAREGRAQRITA